jgi:hypothetical protein
MGELP